MVDSSVVSSAIVDFRRIESPSSINTFRQCPRKYYYQYILKLPVSGSIHTIRGNVIHNVLETFFLEGSIGLSSSDYSFALSQRLLHTFNAEWRQAIPQLQQLKLGRDQIVDSYSESMGMLNNFLQWFLQRLHVEMQQGLSFVDAFSLLTPQVEQHYESPIYKIQGYIDAISHYKGSVAVWDYKTSRKDEITAEYYLQLALYALLYQEKHGKAPDKVGVYFLRYGLRELPVDTSLLQHAQIACEEIHVQTKSDDIASYPQRPGPLCKWGTGQCDFYNQCFGQKKVDDFA